MDSVWRCDVTTSNSKCFRLCNATWIDYLRLSNDFPGFYKRSINAGTWESTITSHNYSRCRVWRCDVTTSNSIQDGGALVVNILVFELRVQLQHCTYQRKTLLFALIKVSTFMCRREISGFSSPLSSYEESFRWNFSSYFFNFILRLGKHMYWTEHMHFGMDCTDSVIVQSFNEVIRNFKNHFQAKWSARTVQGIGSKTYTNCSHGSIHVLDLRKNTRICVYFAGSRETKVKTWHSSIKC